MKKFFFNITLSLFVFTITTTHYSIEAKAYTQDDCIAAWDELNKKYGINSEDYRGGGGVHPELPYYNLDGTLQNGSVANDSTSVPEVESEMIQSTESETPKEEPKHEHKYTANMTVSPTCTEEGVLTYTCSCGDSNTEPVEATGHDYKEEVTKEPTCELDGEKTFTCTLCDDTYTEVIEATGHEEIATTKEKQPTCTETGVQNYSCKVCHKSLRQEEIPAKGHTEGEKVTVKEPTLLSKGQKEIRCTECNEVLETSEIAIPTNYLIIDAIIAVAVLSVIIVVVIMCKKFKVGRKLKRVFRSLKR